MTSKVVALQAWCKHQCQGYKDVEITNMTTSWRNGLAFCAIIHRYHPELIDFDSLDKENIYENNKLAFDTAATLGISPFLDPEDMVALKIPDRLSILTYVSQFYNVFGKQKPSTGQNGTQLKRVAGDNFNEKFEEKKKRTQLATIENSNKSRTNVSSEDLCHVCKSKVFLIERHFDSNRLYHHSCFRKLKTPQIEIKDQKNPISVPFNSVECANKIGVKTNFQKSGGTAIGLEKYAGLNIKNDVTEEKKTSNAVKFIEKEANVSTKLKECIRFENRAMNIYEGNSSENSNINRSSEIVSRSDHQITKESSVAMPSRLSCSDTLLAPNKELETKINKVLKKTHDDEKCEGVGVEKHAPKDKNSNNKLSEMFSSETLSPVGSDLSLLSFETVVNVREEDDRYRQVQHSLSGFNNFNKNVKEKAVQSQNSLNSSIISTGANAKSIHASQISSQMCMDEHEDKILVAYSSPSNLPRYYLTTSNLVSKMSTYSDRNTSVVKDQPIIDPPNIPPRSSMSYNVSKLNSFLPERVEKSNSGDYNPKSFKQEITFDVRTSSPTPKPRRAHTCVRHTAGKPSRESSEFNHSKSHELPMDPIPRMESHSTPKVPNRPLAPPPRHNRLSLTFAPGVNDNPPQLDRKSLPVKAPRFNVAESEKSFQTAGRSQGQDAGKISKFCQITCSVTMPTDVHPLASNSNQPPPRPSEPPACRKKILPTSKFHFGSISSNDPSLEFQSTKTVFKDDNEKSEISAKLQLIDKSLKKVEEEGRILERAIRSGVDSFSDENMVQWFKVVNHRNDLVREETDLLYRWQQLELEKDQAQIDAQLRALMSIPENKKTVAQKFEEDQLIKKLLKTVEKRSNIIDNQEDDRIRYLKEDEALRNTRELSLGERQTLKKK